MGLLLADRALILLGEPCVDALLMVVVLAVQHPDLLFLFEGLEADGAVCQLVGGLLHVLDR